MKSAKSCYLLFAHPQVRSSRANARLLAAARNVENVEIRDLYEAYPEFIIDVPREQRALEAAERVILMHPIHWYSMPALQKLWLDEVLTMGWAFGADGNALRDKDFWLVASTGGSQRSYSQSGAHRHDWQAFLPPYAQTAALCQMRFLEPLVLHDAIEASDAELAAHTERFLARLGAQD